jgi:hypothetical protein
MHSATFGFLMQGPGRRPKTVSPLAMVGIRTTLCQGRPANVSLLYMSNVY